MLTLGYFNKRVNERTYMHTILYEHKYKESSTGDNVLLSLAVLSSVVVVVVKVVIVTAVAVVVVVE